MIQDRRYLDHIATYLGLTQRIREVIKGFRICSGKSNCKGTKFYLVGKTGSGMERHYCAKCNYSLTPSYPPPSCDQIVDWNWAHSNAKYNRG